MTTDPKPVYDLSGKRVYVAGHRGMVGSALVRRLEAEDCEVLSVGREEVDLRRQADVEGWMAKEKPQAVFVAAATVGGILANDTRPAEFIYDNLLIEANLIDAAFKGGVDKLLFLGTSCAYPKFTSQPLVEDALLSGALEPTNQWYAVAKIAGVMLCRAYRRQYACDFISAMPTNLYGENDNFDLESSHVVPALIAKAHAAKMNGDADMEVWGTGKPRREFLYVDDAADAIVHLMKYYSDDAHINVGTGADISIAELAEIIRTVTGFEGGVRYITDKPDGTLVKRLDITRLNALGWKAKTDLRDGIERTYAWYAAQSLAPVLAEGG